MAHKVLIARLLHNIAPRNFKGLIYITGRLPDSNAPRLPPLPPFAVAAFDRTKETSGSNGPEHIARRAKALLLGPQAYMLALKPSRPVKLKREAPQQMSSAPRSVPGADAGGGKLAPERQRRERPIYDFLGLHCTGRAAQAGRKLRAGGWSVAEMLRPILPARKCGRNAITNCCQREVWQKCRHDCCQIMTSRQYKRIITPFEGTGMRSGRFEGNAPPNSFVTFI